MTEPTLKPVEPTIAVEKQRERSTVGFPYTDLNDAIRVASAVHELGDRCGHDQLAPSLGYKSVDNGAYSLTLGTARHFGLISTSKEGITLNPLGHRILDPRQEVEAKRDAFLAVPLYKALYEKYQGYPLPPNNIGLEAVLVELGVAPKQKDKARQVLQRSAEQAGFYSQGRERLVAPAIVRQPQDDGRPPRDEEFGGGGGGSDGPKLPTLIQGLVEKLPAEGSVWSQTEQKQWLDAAQVIFGLVYKVERVALPAPSDSSREAT